MSKKYFSCIIIFLFVTAFSVKAQTNNIIGGTKQTLSSPDGNYIFTFYQESISPAKKQMYYDLSYKGKTVIKKSELGIQIQNRILEDALGIPNDSFTNWCENMNFTGITKTQSDTIWHPVYGEWSSIRDHYNEMTIKFIKGANDESHEMWNKSKCYFLNIEVRAYNEGIAFRYVFPEASNGLFLHITGEQTSFNFEDGTLAYHTAWAQGPYNLLPLKDWKEEAERPLTMKLSNGLYVSLLEAQMVDYARTKFKLISDNRFKHRCIVALMR